jgi:serine/threonine-protein kinase
MLTGKRETSNKEFAFDAGADDYLTKPFSLREVAARVKAMLRRTEQIRGSASALPAPNPVASSDGETDPYLGALFAGKYKLTEKLGEGGAGTVYGGMHLGLNRAVAVKFLHSFLISHAESRARFQREAEMLSGIKHPGVVEVFDFGIERGQPYIVLEKVSGIPLAKILKANGPMKVSEALKIFEQVCDAMDTAHKAGVVHRDLKPDNIIVDTDSSGSVIVKLIDMGLAKSTRSTSKLTETGITLGTALYMSPEQCQAKEVDHRSDIYSMGCVMYEVLTGKPPFEGKDHIDVFMKHIKSEPQKFGSKISDKLKAGRIEGAVLRALSKDPNQRQQTFAELKKQLPIRGWF